MQRPIPILALFAAILVTAAPAGEGLPEISWWRLVKVIDESTLTFHCENGLDKGRTLTIKLACIGKAPDNREATAYIKCRLHDHRVSFWPLVTDVTAWEARPMCVILDMDLPGRGGGAVYDFPLLNEELLAWGRVPYEDVIVKADPYQLKARLVSAKLEWEVRANQQKKRWSKFVQSTDEVGTNDFVRLRVTVQDVVQLRAFTGALTPTDDFDPRFGLTLRIDSCVPALTNLQSGTIVTFAVHSPSMFLGGAAEKGTTHEITLPRRKAINLADGTKSAVLPSEFNRVSAEELNEAKRRIRLLHEGMSVKDVFESLGLGTYYGKLGGNRSGDQARLVSEGFYARMGHSFSMRIDYGTNNNGIVVLVRLDDEFWESRNAGNLERNAQPALRTNSL